MTDVWCVRADFGTYAKQFLEGGYVAIGWIPDSDLSEIQSRDELYPLYKHVYPLDTSNIVIGQQVGQIARFLLEIQGADYVITPAANTEWLHYGVVAPGRSYFYDAGTDGCPYRHRRRVNWHDKPMRRSDFSVPFQNTIRSSLTVFAVSHREHFFNVIGRNDLAPRVSRDAYDPYRAVIDRLLELTPEEFEVLITHLLTALGFEGSKHTGKPGDGMVDATGELDIANLAKVKVFVQAKRYKVGAKIEASTVRALRQSIPAGGQGAFITTADFQGRASDVAVEQGFPRIGLVNGRQLVDLLVQYWAEIPQEFKDKLGLKPGLVRA